MTKTENDAYIYIYISLTLKVEDPINCIRFHPASM